MKMGRALFTPTCINIPISAHKSLEIEVGRGNKWKIFNCSFRWTSRVDHAGPEFDFEVYRLFFFSIRIYDIRHWNSKKNRWYKPYEDTRLQDELDDDSE